MSPFLGSHSRLPIVFKPARTAGLIYRQRERETGGNEWRRNKRAMSRRQRAISVTQPLIPFCRASLPPHATPYTSLCTCTPPTIRVSLASFQLRSSTVFGSTRRRRRRRCDSSLSSSSSRRSSEELEASSLLVDPSFELTILFDGYERSFCLFVGYKQAFSEGTSGAVLTFRHRNIRKSVVAFPDKPVRKSFAYHESNFYAVNRCQ